MKHEITNKLIVNLAIRNVHEKINELISVIEYDSEGKVFSSIDQLVLNLSLLNKIVND